MMEEFGGRVASVWRGLRPATRSIVETALLSASTVVAAAGGGRAGAASTYDPRAEWELSRLLAALDERAAERGAGSLNAEQTRELGLMADTCAGVLLREARSAEVFGQLLTRALRARNYVRVDALADALTARLAPSETCELARHLDPAVRAIAQEALLLAPTEVLINLLGDPVDAAVARDALERQADEYGSEEARWVVGALDEAELGEDDF